MNMGLVILRTLSSIAGAVFIYGAIRAILEGNFKSPKEVVYGNYVGVSHISGSDNPFIKALVRTKVVLRKM
jgi:hypothetical protein